MTFLNNLRTWVINQSSFVEVIELWKIDKKRALVHLFNRTPNITYPFVERHHKTGQKLYLEAAYNETSKELRKQHGHEDKAMKSKLFWWRQLWHAIGGVLVAGLSNLALTGFLWFGLALTIPLLGYGVPGSITAVKSLIWASILRPWLVIAAIGVIIGYKEFTWDKSINPWKNWLDLIFWILGSALWLFIL